MYIKYYNFTDVSKISVKLYIYNNIYVRIYVCY